MLRSAMASAQVSIGSLNSTVSPSSIRSSSKRKQNSRRVRCAYFTQERGESSSSSRRVVTISIGLLLQCLSIPKHANSATIFDKYVKRKRLDPLEAYVPAVILTQLQIEDLGKTLEVDEPQYAACRSILRSGPAASLRVNIRAVAQYASDDGDGKTALANVDQCLRALEELDSLLLRASRNDPQASVKSMKTQIGTAVDALNGLLQTVPSEVLEKGKAIADAYRTLGEDEIPENLDPEIKQLESIL